MNKSNTATINEAIVANAIKRDKENEQERWIHQMTSNLGSADILFLKSSSDFGTVRNSGRRGSMYAPQAILSVVKKLANHSNLKWSEVEVASELLEKEDFLKAQNHYAESIEKITREFNSIKKWIQLGGGHDHIFPFLKALNKNAKKIVVINIDAHLDTRTDELKNSGTPFRQFAETFEGEFELIQLGIHDFANTKSTMSDLGAAREVVATFEDLKHLTKNFSNNYKAFERMIPYHKDTLYLFSLDADALESSIMEGVSAVNHRGLPYHFVEELLIYSLDVLKTKHFGIYEYNPVYDNLSQKGARTLAGLIYKILDH